MHQSLRVIVAVAATAALLDVAGPVEGATVPVSGRYHFEVTLDPGTRRTPGNATG